MPERLAQRAISFTHGHQEVRLAPRVAKNNQLVNWVPPPSVNRKLNFDAGRLVEWGRSLAFVVKDLLGDVVLAWSHQSTGFPRPDVAEAEACLFGLCQALSTGSSSLVTESDSLYDISKLRNKSQPSSVLGFYIFEILKLVVNALMVLILLGDVLEGAGIEWHMRPLTIMEPAPIDLF